MFERLNEEIKRRTRVVRTAAQPTPEAASAMKTFLHNLTYTTPELQGT